MMAVAHESNGYFTASQMPQSANFISNAMKEFFQSGQFPKEIKLRKATTCSLKVWKRHMKSNHWRRSWWWEVQIETVCVLRESHPHKLLSLRPLPPFLPSQLWLPSPGISRNCVQHQLSAQRAGAAWARALHPHWVSENGDGKSGLHGWAPVLIQGTSTTGAGKGWDLKGRINIHN